MGKYRVIWIRDPQEALIRPPDPERWSVLYMSPEQAFPAMPRGDWTGIVLDCPLPGWTVAELLDEAHRNCPGIPVLIRDLGVSPGEAVRLPPLGADRLVT